MIREESLTLGEAATTDGESASTWLERQWIVAGAISGSAILLPVPLVDDYLQSKCRRFAVAKTLKSHGLEAELDKFEPYYGSPPGWFSGLGSLALKAPLKLALFPIRKPLRLVRSVRDLPLEIVRTFLLGRTLDRFLRGRMADASPDERPVLDVAVATDLRRAFGKAFARMDFHVLKAATKDAFAASSRLLSAALAARRRTAANESLLDELQTDPAVETETRKVERELTRPEMLRLFREFDARFDRAWREVRERNLARAASN